MSDQPRPDSSPAAPEPRKRAPSVPSVPDVKQPRQSLGDASPKQPQSCVDVIIIETQLDTAEDMLRLVVPKNAFTAEQITEMEKQMAKDISPEADPTGAFALIDRLSESAAKKEEAEANGIKFVPRQYRAKARKGRILLRGERMDQLLIYYTEI